MVVTNWAKNQIAFLIGNSGTSANISTSIPSYFIIGSGSGVALSTDTAMLRAVDRQAFTSTDLTTTQKITWQGDWSSTELSGLAIREFGVILSGAGLTGSIWSRTNFPGVTFDGSNEMRIEETWEVY